MKINYKTHPILEKLEKRSLGRMPVLECDRYFFDNNGGQILNEAFKRNIDSFKEIIYISSAFADSAKMAEQKLIDLYSDIVCNDISDLIVSGTFIHSESVYFFSHTIKKDLSYDETVLFAFNRNGVPYAFHESVEHERFAWVSNFYTDKVDRKDGVEFFIAKIIMKLALFYMFKRYATVETKYIAPNSKVRKDLKVYKNDTNLGITYLTSKWFTNLVRSEGFLVRGHFRLQPKKVNGEWTKELIWIEGFKKSGYTSKAQILDQQ